MDNITHGLFGLALAGVALANPQVATTADRATIVATALVASQLPDVDIIYRAFGKWPYLEQHRGWSHSLPAQVVGAALIAGVAQRFSGLTFGFLLLYSLLAVVLHVISDFTNAYGTQALIPWSKQRIAWDLVPTFDPVIAVVLTIGSLAWLGKRVEPQQAGLTALAVVGIWVIVRLMLHKWAAALVHKHTQGLKSVLPTIKPWTWRFVADLPAGQVLQGEVNLLNQQIIELGRLKADAEEPWISLLRKNKEGQIFLNHSRHPHVELLQQTREGTSVIRVTDLAGQKAAAEIEVKSGERSS